MSQFSNDLETKLFNATLRGITYTSPETVYLALYTTSAGEDGSGTELSAGDRTAPGASNGARGMTVKVLAAWDARDRMEPQP